MPYARRAQPGPAPLVMKPISAPVIRTPIASGLTVPSSSQPGPLPMKMSRPLPENVPPPMAKSPRICSTSPKLKSRSLSWNRNVGVAGRSTTMVPPVPRSMVWSTTAPVVLIEKPTLASRAKPLPPAPTRPTRMPATPPVTVRVGLGRVSCFVIELGAKMIRAPEASLRPGLVPPVLAPLEIEALANAMRVTWLPTGPARSNATSARMTTPPMVMSTSLATSRRNGPFGSESSRALPTIGARLPVAAHVTVQPPATAATVTTPAPSRSSRAACTTAAVGRTYVGGRSGFGFGTSVISMASEISPVSMRPLPLTSTARVKVPAVCERSTVCTSATPAEPCVVVATSTPANWIVSTTATAVLFSCRVSRADRHDREPDEGDGAGDLPGEPGGGEDDRARAGGEPHADVVGGAGDTRVAEEERDLGEGDPHDLRAGRRRALLERDDRLQALAHDGEADGGPDLADLHPQVGAGGHAQADEGAADVDLPGHRGRGGVDEQLERWRP